MEEHDRLHRVEARREPLEAVFVLPPLPVLAQCAEPIGQLVVVGHDGSGIAGGTEVLARIEAEGGSEADRSDAEAVARRAVSLAGVLEEGEILVQSKRAGGRECPQEGRRGGREGGRASRSSLPPRRPSGSRL